MRTALVTGSYGLVGSVTVEALLKLGYRVVGVDNGMREYFFGTPTKHAFDGDYVHVNTDVRDLRHVFDVHGRFDAVVHTAAQPSHDWSAKEPLTDFGVNTVATVRLLELVREHCPESPFVYTSTSKVYGDTVNRLVYEETPTRLWPKYEYIDGVDETMSVDSCRHSLFGCSKLSADLYVQEYGKRFGIPTVCFRPGCITGADHAGAELHGFLSYLVKCVVNGTPYRVIGYGGIQVRDNIHATDLVSMFLEFIQDPSCGEVYNAGGGVPCSCSILEALEYVSRHVGKVPEVVHVPEARYGDHKWWVSDCKKFRSRYPSWAPVYNTWQKVIDSVGSF